MEDTKKIKVILSEQDIFDIKTNLNSGYQIFKNEVNKYDIILSFKMEKRNVKLDIEVVYTHKSKPIKIHQTFYGTVNVISVFDKVFTLDSYAEDFKVLVKVESFDNLKDNFTASLFNSNNIFNCGNINLYNHVLYTNFSNDIELITLCYKYSKFCSHILDSKSIVEVTEILDMGLYKIDTSFQSKLEYYGYKPKTEIDEIWESKVLDTIMKKAETKDEIKNHIVLLTQCLFDSGKYSSLKNSITEKIESEVMRYKGLVS